MGARADQNQIRPHENKLHQLTNLEPAVRIRSDHTRGTQHNEQQASDMPEAQKAATMTDPRFSGPETSVMVAGLGGLPAVILLVTPLRNALTLAANNPNYTTMQCYREVFKRAPFKGGSSMAYGAIPASVALGPAYHMFSAMSNGNTAVACTMAGVCESMILFAPETRNAQLALHGKTTQGMRPWGPGLGYHVSRNILSMSGLRVLSEPMYQLCKPWAPNSPSLRFGTDMACNIVVSALSTPLHMAYTWRATNIGDTKSLVEILRHQWMDKGKLRPTVGRDICLRIAYNATIYTLYGAVERTVVSMWPW